MEGKCSQREAEGYVVDSVWFIGGAGSGGGGGGDGDLEIGRHDEAGCCYRSFMTWRRCGFTIDCTCSCLEV